MAYIKTGIGEVSVEVDVDFDDLINDLSKGEREHIAKMILGDAVPDDVDARTAAINAINAIRQGRYDDAVTMLEREFLPKWTDRAACEAAYREVMGQ